MISKMITLASRHRLLIRLVGIVTAPRFVETQSWLEEHGHVYGAASSLFYLFLRPDFLDDLGLERISSPVKSGTGFGGSGVIPEFVKY